MSRKIRLIYDEYDEETGTRNSVELVEHITDELEYWDAIVNGPVSRFISAMGYWIDGNVEESIVHGKSVWATDVREKIINNYEAERKVAKAKRK